MAYEFALEEDSGAPFTDALSTEIIEFTIGFDLERDVAVIMSVMLVPVEEAHDLRFGIRERDLSLDWKVSAPDYRIDTVRRFVPKSERGAVLIKSCEAIETLVTFVRPAAITMETYYPALSSPALAKYGLIADAVRACDYRLADEFRDNSTSKNHWLFEKNA